MKNMFKMMGVALLAGAMLFTACKKDKEDTTPAEQQVASVITVNFDGSEWFTTSKDMKMTAGQVNTKEFKVYNTNSTEADVKFSTVLAKGTYGFGDNPNVWAVCWKDNGEYTERSNNGSITITELDTESKTMTATIAAEVKEASEANYHQLAVVLTNAKWAE